MVNCNLSNFGVCQKHLSISCTGAGVDLNGCPYWAIVQAIKELNETRIKTAQEGIGI